ncbi:UDP-2,3-diacylglucosamine diphosphatase [Ferrimonas balearica]|uniref:UDP-2,3-diacylglucosamine diphosphatase n=1 Tax=Ferrimonas balearica TaxID=44012 RepID=UPI001C97E762|nr:UDP-2,3-diacylglucosamine diphosphatase [Ferrimonas balearica]MBY5979907.1 UDP-2,3-diacylglucosamine diphosphatase [Ferrimonas balearica]
MTQRAAVSGPRTLIIGDLHLSPTRPDITQAFLRFLDNELDGADALYIVGDLFEAWIGDDDVTDFTQSIAEQLKRASAKLPIYFCHGNRDFLLGPRFAQRCGMSLLPEPEVLELYGKTTLILHGDSLCTEDREYQKFRRLRNRPWFRLLVLSLPLSLRRGLARRARARSKMHTQMKDARIMDVSPKAVDSLMERYGARRLIHGHTHRPAIHDLPQQRQRLVVGDWYSQDSVLVITPNDATLESRAL